MAVISENVVCLTVYLFKSFRAVDGAALKACCL